MFETYCFIDKSKKVIPFRPETDIKYQPYNFKQWRRLFPFAPPKNNYRDLQMTNIGVYSIAKKHTCEVIVDAIRSALPDNKKIVVTEGTGGVGGLSMFLAKAFHRVNIVEITETHTNVIRNNMKVYGINRDRYKVIQGDFLNLMLTLKQDVVFLDPPWGGVDYRKRRQIQLALNNVNIACIVNRLAKNKVCKLFVMLVPYNYDLVNFLEIMKEHDVEIKRTNKNIRNKHNILIVKIN